MSPKEAVENGSRSDIMKKITQQEIADILGVSRLTVSKALNGAPGVRQEMRQLIMQKAKELGYHKQAQQWGEAELSVTPESKWVSLFAFEGGEMGTFWGQVINGIISELVKHGVDLHICLIPSFTKDNFKLPLNFNPTVSQGIITIGKFTEAHIQKIKSFDLPIVSIDTVASANDYRLLVDTVMMCNEQPVTEITAHLIRAGHRKIGYVGETASCRSFRERWLGFKRGMERSNLPINASFCCVKQGMEAMTSEMIQSEIAEMTSLPTALVCANDFTALNVIQAFHKRGLRVPQDIAVSGFDNAYESNLLNITTVDSYKVELGERAAAELLTRIDHPNHPLASVRMATKVILRESTNKRL